jgi:hypothetical protein
MAAMLLKSSRKSKSHQTSKSFAFGRDILFLKSNAARQKYCKMSEEAGDATLPVAVRVDVGVARAVWQPSGVILPDDT